MNRKQAAAKARAVRAAKRAQQNSVLVVEIPRTDAFAMFTELESLQTPQVAKLRQQLLAAAFGSPR